MGRYGTPVLLGEREILSDTALLTARMSWVGHLVAAIFLLGWVIAIPILSYLGGFSFKITSLFDALLTAFSVLVVGGVGLVCLVAGLLFLSSALAALKPSNWIMRVAEEGLYIKLRSYTDFRLSDEDKIVVFIPRAEIRKVRSTRQQKRVLARGDDITKIEDTHFEKHEHLEIQLYGPDLKEIELCLADEKKRNCPTFLKGVTSRAKGSALTIQPKGVIRLEWKTRRSRINPTMKKTLALLSQYYATSSIEAAEQASIMSLNKHDQEKRLLDLAGSGNVMDAVTLSRELYGFNLTEAKRFIDELLDIRPH